MEGIVNQLRQSAEIKVALAEKSAQTIRQIADTLIDALRNGHRVYLAGNGGSAADAQHIAGELVGRFKLERRALPVLALTTDTSVLTSVSNDYGFDACFARQVDAFVEKDDVFVGISTSGNSPNIIEAMAVAKKKGAKTVGLSGGDGGEVRKAADICLTISSNDTPRVQEGHITVGHIVCGLVESALASPKASG